MKKYNRIFYLFLLTLFLFISCAGRPSIVPVTYVISEIEPKITFYPIPETEPEVVLSPIERIIQRIKLNGTDIEKYFILGSEGQIIVKAEITDIAGDFEITYDLENLEVISYSIYRVPFLLTQKESDIAIEDTLIWRPRVGNAGLLLSFDDDYIETWERYFDLFDRYNAKVTFFIQGEFDPFCLEAVSRGHDIGYHSLNHLDLRRLSEESFMEETLEPLEAFRLSGISIASFAFPFGFSEPWMHEILFGSFDILRGYGVTFRLYREDNIRSAYISSRAIDNTILPGEENFERIILLMLRTVKFLDGDWVLPLTTHDISNAAWGITPRRLEFLLSAASEMGLKFHRFSDFSVP